MSNVKAFSRALKDLNINDGSACSSAPSKQPSVAPSSKPSASIAQQYNVLLTQAKQFEKVDDAARALAAYVQAHSVYSGDAKLQAKIAKLRAAAAVNSTAAAQSVAELTSQAKTAPTAALQREHEQETCAVDDDDAPLVAAVPPHSRPAELSSLSSSSSTSTTSATATISPSSLPPPIAVPPHLWSCLFPYQHTGICWMHSLFTRGHGGILGDDMGLGKQHASPSRVTVKHCTLSSYTLPPPAHQHQQPALPPPHALRRQDAASRVIHHGVVLQQARATALPHCNNVTLCPRLVSRVIVCAPLSVMPHWQQEFAKCAEHHATRDFVREKL
jgi:hypothetical protein